MKQKIMNQEIYALPVMCFSPKENSTATKQITNLEDFVPYYYFQVQLNGTTINDTTKAIEIQSGKKIPVYFYNQDEIITNLNENYWGIFLDIYDLLEDKIATPNEIKNYSKIYSGYQAKKQLKLIEQLGSAHYADFIAPIDYVIDSRFPGVVRARKQFL